MSRRNVLIICAAIVFAGVGLMIMSSFPVGYDLPSHERAARIIEKDCNGGGIIIKMKWRRDYNQNEMCNDAIFCVYRSL